MSRPAPLKSARGLSSADAGHGFRSGATWQVAGRWRSKNGDFMWDLMGLTVVNSG